MTFEKLSGRLDVWADELIPLSKRQVNPHRRAFTDAMVD